MPRPRSRGSRSLTTRPSMRISPAVGSSKPAIIRRVVVFPQPEGPTSTTNSPSSIARLMLLTAATEPNVLRRFCSSIRATLESLFAHDLTRKPEPIPDQVRDMLFRDHALSPHHAEAESAREVLADDKPDDHQR